MPAFTVLGVTGEPRSWNSEKGGPMLAYQVTFTEHSDRPVEWSRKASSEAPTAGQSVDGTIDWNAKFGPRFKQEFQQKGGGGTWKPRDPGEIAAIQRQHSQEMAIRFLSVNNAAVKAMNDKDARAALNHVLKPLIDWFQRDITAGVKIAEEDSQTKQSYGQRKDPTLTGQSDVPNNDAPSHGDPGPQDVPFPTEAA